MTESDRATVLKRKSDDLRQLFVSENPDELTELLGGETGDLTLWNKFMETLVSDPVFHSDDELDEQGQWETCQLKWRSPAVEALVKLFDRLHGPRAKHHNRVPREPKLKLDRREMEYLSRPELAPAVDPTLLRECLEEASSDATDSQQPATTPPIARGRATRAFNVSSAHRQQGVETAFTIHI